MRRACQPLVVGERAPHHLCRRRDVHARGHLARAGHVRQLAHLNHHLARQRWRQRALRLCARRCGRPARQSAWRRQLLRCPQRRVGAQFAARRCVQRVPQSRAEGRGAHAARGASGHARCCLVVAAQLGEVGGAVRLRHDAQARLRDATQAAGQATRRVSARGCQPYHANATHFLLLPPRLRQLHHLQLTVRVWSRRRGRRRGRQRGDWGGCCSSSPELPPRRCGSRSTAAWRLRRCGHCTRGRTPSARPVRAPGGRDGSGKRHAYTCASSSCRGSGSAHAYTSPAPLAAARTTRARGRGAGCARGAGALSSRTNGEKRKLRVAGARMRCAIRCRCAMRRAQP